MADASSVRVIPTNVPLPTHRGTSSSAVTWKMDSCPLRAANINVRSGSRHRGISIKFRLYRDRSVA